MHPEWKTWPAWHRSIAMAVAVVLCFLAVAAFSPLHKHDAAGRCSLNHFEHAMQGETESASPSLELCHFDWTAASHAPVLERGAYAFTALLRGPPASF